MGNSFSLQPLATPGWNHAAITCRTHLYISLWLYFWDLLWQDLLLGEHI